MNLTIRVSALISMLALGLTLPACNEVKETSSDSDVAGLRAELYKNIDSLIDSLNDLALQHHKLNDAFFKNKKHTEVWFNAKKDMGFQNLDTMAGPLLVSIESVQPHLDGYKVLFWVGNPTSAQFANTKIKLRWNHSSPPDLSSYMKWKGSFKEKSFSLTDQNLLSGTWNQVELFISPCTVQELEYIEFSVEINNILLNTPAK